MWEDRADKWLILPDLAFVIVVEDFYLNDQKAHIPINQEKWLHIYFIFKNENPLARILGLYGDLGCHRKFLVLELEDQFPYL